MPDQNFKNHARMVPLYHYILFLGIIVLLGGSVYKIIRNCSMNQGGVMVPALLLLTAMVLIILAWYARVFALKAQDRAIRAEENLRYFVMTGKLFDPKLRIGQIIALRFASDSEFVSLAKRAVDENMKPVEIKKAIQNWKADHDRV